MAFASFQKRESGTKLAPLSGWPMAAEAKIVKQIRSFAGG